MDTRQDYWENLYVLRCSKRRERRGVPRVSTWQWAQTAPSGQSRTPSTPRAASSNQARLEQPVLRLLPMPSMHASESNARVGFSLMVRGNCKRETSGCVATFTVSRCMKHALGSKRMPQVFEERYLNKVASVHLLSISWSAHMLICSYAHPLIC